MIKNPLQILEEATREELSACVQLLAQSVVQHRVKFGVINLHQAIEPGEVAVDEDQETGLLIQGKEVLEEALDWFSGTFLIISHDRYFLDKSVDRVIEIRDGEVTAYLGGYTDYLEQTGQA